MTAIVTTIKVDANLRDQLKAQAMRHNRNLGEHLEALSRLAEHVDRMTAFAASVSATSADMRDEWLEDAKLWEATELANVDY
jgi:methyl-accepting chemotaxis protein